ncbi:ComEC/Rec2 family competence protein [Bifidobacterium xylocopae]|nr:ComEC/Rec2 family competence protein [Bifidobacterium xylocopae]
MSLMALVSMVAGSAAVLSSLVVVEDSADWLIGGGNVQVTARVRAHSPTMASDLMGQDCRTEVSIIHLEGAGLSLGSRAKARLYATDDGCNMRRGGLYQVEGQLKLAEMGGARYWLTVPKTSRANRETPRAVSKGRVAPMRMLREPGRMDAMLSSMQEAFLRQTRSLDDQGQILVPGLTMGVLGQESYLPPDERPVDREPPSPAYAKRLKDAFKRSGIMHLMAVSGSHFLLVGSVVGVLLRRLRVPRCAQTVALVVSCLLLARAMYPSDSVLRAQSMCMVSALALGLGRNGQSVSALCWTAVLTLLVEPPLARSFGYALSCAAVLGIAICGRPLAEAWKGHLPSFLAQPLATTLAAQTATLPIQVLMSPQLPAFSPLANVIVAPFVDTATICGLLGLCLALPCPAATALLVRLASWGTWVMERAASLLGGPGAVVLPWPGGPGGSLAILLLECASGLLALSVIVLRRRMALDSDPAVGAAAAEGAGELGGIAVHYGISSRLAVWAGQGWSMLCSLSYGT